MDRKAGGAGGKGSAINDENKQSSQTASNRKRQDKRSDAKKEDNSQSAQPKGAPQATAEQMRMAQLFQNSTVSDKALQEKAEKVQAVTNCSAEEAILALHDCGNDVQAAVDLFLEKGSTLTDQWETATKKKTKPAQSQATRGRPNQRSTSSRGGKANTAQSAPRSTYVQDELSGQADQTRQTGFQSGRQANEGGGRSGQTQADGPPRRDNPEAESSKWDDADDNWQETLSRQSKIFERSSTSTASQNVPIPGQSSAAGSRAGGQGSTNSSGTPSFSAMVQKPSTWSSAVQGNVAQPGPQKSSVNEANGWKQQQQQQQQSQKSSGAAPSSVGMQKSAVTPQTGHDLDQPHLNSVNQSLPHNTNTRSDTTITSDASQQLGMKFSGLTFDNSSYQQVETLNPLITGAQSQVYTGSARSPYTSESRDSLPGATSMNASRSIGQNAAMEPLSPTKSTSGQSRNTGSPSHMPIGVPSQTMSFGNTDHDLPTNTYSAKNIQSSGSFVNSQSQTFSGTSRGQNTALVGDTRGPSAQGQTMSNPSHSPINPYVSSQDSRYSQQPTAASLSKSPSGRNDAVAGFGQQRSQNETATQYSNPLSHQSQQTSPVKSSTSTLPANFSSYGAQPTDMSTRGAGFNSYQGSAQSATTQTQPSGMVQQIPSVASQMTSTVQAPRTSATAATGFTMPKSAVQPSAPMGLNKAYGASQPNVSQSFLSQQPYLPQSQPTQYGQNTLPAMFAQNSAMEAQYDPRILSMTSMLPQNMSLQDYQGYQNNLTGLRDSSANLGYSTPDQVRRGVEALQGVQGTAQVSQQQMAGQPYGMSYGHTGQNYVYSPPSMTPTYHPYNNPQMYTTPAANISAGYSKGTNAGLGNSYSGYGQDLGVGDKLQNTAAYVAGNVSAFGTDPYLRNQGMLAGGSDLQAYPYGSSKTNNKSYDKPSQSYGMQMGSQPSAAAHQYNNQYFPMAQQQLHQMSQGMPQNSAGQTANHKQGVKGQNQYQQWNN